MRIFMGLRAAVMLGAAAVAALGTQLPAQERDEPAARPEASRTEREASDEKPAAERATRRDGSADSQQAKSQNDALLATCLLIDNQVEAALGEFAQKRAESDEVRQFAEKMAQEHSQAAESLKRLAMAGVDAKTAKRADTARADNAAAAEAPAESRPGSREEGANASNPQAIFFVTLKKEMGEQCLQSAQKELGAKKGEEFDKCYINAQVMAHQHMLDGLTVMERHAGQELKQQIMQAKETTQTHLDEAKEIAKKIEGKPGAKDAARAD
jgi:predicted outer membrane protein